MSKEILNNKELFSPLYEEFGSAQLARNLGVGVTSISYYAKKHGLKFNKKKRNDRASKPLSNWFDFCRKDKFIKTSIIKLPKK